MRGLLLKELLNFADSQLGEALVDALLKDLPLSSGAAYTTIGDYPDEEFQMLIRGLSSVMDISPAELQRRFGSQLFKRAICSCGELFSECSTCFEVFEAAQPAIWRGIRKLNFVANVPHFHTERCGNRHMICVYRSCFDLADLCEGMMDACIQHYHETADIIRRDIQTDAETIAIFSVSLKTSQPQANAS